MSNYAFEGPKWASNTVTWSFATAGGAFSSSISGAYQTIVENALARWAQVANITFQQVADSATGPDLRIGWGTFTGSQVGETDYTYQNSGASQVFTPGTEVRLEDPSADYVGSSMGSTYQGTSTTLYQTALHEIGHGLGLAHSTDAAAIMYPTLGPADRDLDGSDMQGIQALYGAPAASVSQQTIAAAPQQSATQPVVPPPVTPPPGDVAVYRFFDSTNGTQFLTADLTERNSVIQTRPDLVYEGVGMGGVSPSASDPNATPLYRFFDTHTGTHFFTASAAEEQSIVATRPDLILEQSSIDEHLTQQAGDVPVYRFFDRTDGTHFFTASAAEQASIASGRPDMSYEGVAFYAPQVS